MLYSFLIDEAWPDSYIFYKHQHSQEIWRWHMGIICSYKRTRALCHWFPSTWRFPWKSFFELYVHCIVNCIVFRIIWACTAIMSILVHLVISLFGSFDSVMCSASWSQALPHHLWQGCFTFPHYRSSIPHSVIFLSFHTMPRILLVL